MASRTYRFVLLSILGALFLSGLDARQIASPNIPPPPVPPLPISVGASRGLMLHPGYRVHSEGLIQPNPIEDTVILPLSAGLTTISVPLRTDSNVLSDIFTTLPAGSRIWAWDAVEQKFVEGFDQKLSLGQGAVLYVPSPTVITIKGSSVLDSEVPLDLVPGWNLVGVPYTQPLPRSAQSAYVDSVPLPLNDAVTDGAIGPTIYSIDNAGQNPIGDDEAFEPMNAYWVYSNGADMLELRPQLVQGSGDIAAWFAKSIGTFALNFIGQQLFSSWEDPNAEVLQKLQDISAQITGLETTMDSVQQRLAALSSQISIAKTEILLAIGDAPVQAVSVALDTNLRDPNGGVDKSFASFVEKAKTADGVKSVTADTRTQFALKVINDWDYPNKFFAVKNAILPNGGAGVLDNMAQKIITERNAAIAAGTTPPSAWDSYRAMETYFNRLIGIQVECMLLITNAREQLASVPQYAANNKGVADAWRQGTFAPAIQAEADRFRALVEDLMMRSLSVTNGIDQAAVSVPPIYRDKIIPRLDFTLMNLLNEPAGLRVRYLGTPQMFALNLYRVDMTAGDSRPARSALMAPPRSDSGLWKPQTGYVAYDSWGINQTTFAVELSAQKDWLMYKKIVPICATPSDSCLSANRYTFFMYDTVGLDGPTPQDQQAEKNLGHGVATVALQAMDGTSSGDLAPSPTGTPFGSIFLAKRPTAGTALHVFGRNQNFVNKGCSAGVRSGVDYDFVGISNCGNATAWLTQTESFNYLGAAPGVKSTGTVTLGVGFNFDYDVANSFAWLGIYTSDGAEKASTRNTKLGMFVYTNPMTWVAGQKYMIQLGVQSGNWQVCSGKNCRNIWPGAVIGRRGPVGFTIDQ